MENSENSFQKRFFLTEKKFYLKTPSMIECFRMKLKLCAIRRFFPFRLMYRKIMFHLNKNFLCWSNIRSGESNIVSVVIFLPLTSQPLIYNWNIENEEDRHNSTLIYWYYMYWYWYWCALHSANILHKWKQKKFVGKHFSSVNSDMVH